MPKNGLHGRGTVLSEVLDGVDGLRGAGFDLVGGKLLKDGAWLEEAETGKELAAGAVASPIGLKDLKDAGASFVWRCLKQVGEDGKLDVAGPVSEMLVDKGEYGGKYGGGGVAVEESGLGDKVFISFECYEVCG